MIRRTGFAAVLLFVAALAFPAASADKCPDDKVRGGPGEWMLALSWQPAWCEVVARNRALPECMRSYSGVQALGLHGLWPQWGEYCKVDPGQIRAACAKDRCALAPVPLAAETEKLVAEVMPASVSRLDRYEWTKHGGCSGMAPDAYFRTAARLVEAARASTLGRLLGDRVGETVRRSELCAAFAADFGADKTAALLFSLRETRKGAYLTEVRVSLKGDDGTALALDTAHVAPLPKGDCDRPGDKTFFIDPPGYQTGETPTEARPMCR
jgi:ribonuclease T2